MGRGCQPSVAVAGRRQRRISIGQGEFLGDVHSARVSPDEANWLAWSSNRGKMPCPLVQIDASVLRVHRRLCRLQLARECSSARAYGSLFGPFARAAAKNCCMIRASRECTAKPLENWLPVTPPPLEAGAWLRATTESGDVSAEVDGAWCRKDGRRKTELGVGLGRSPHPTAGCQYRPLPCPERGDQRTEDRGPYRSEGL